MYLSSLLSLNRKHLWYYLCVPDSYAEHRNKEVQPQNQLQLLVKNQISNQMDHINTGTMFK